MWFINAIPLANYVTGTAQPKMNQENMNSIMVALPPLAEQQRIVEHIEELLPLIERCRWCCHFKIALTFSFHRRRKLRTITNLREYPCVFQYASIQESLPWFCKRPPSQVRRGNLDILPIYLSADGHGIVTAKVGYLKEELTDTKSLLCRVPSQPSVGYLSWTL